MNKKDGGYRNDDEAGRRGPRLPADSHCEVRDADGKTGCDSTQLQVARPGAGEEEMFPSPSARLFSVEVQFPIISPHARGPLASILTFPLCGESEHFCLSLSKWVTEGNRIRVAFGVLLIRRRHYKWELSQRMFTFGSAAPSATMGDTHIAHSLTGTGEYMAAPRHQERKWEGGWWRRGWRRNEVAGAGGRPQRIENKKKNIGDDDSEDETKQKRLEEDEEVEETGGGVAAQADGQEKFPAFHPSESWAVQMFGWR